MWGGNQNGQLGLNDFANRNNPEQVIEVSNYTIEYVKCCTNSTFIITTCNIVYSFGNDSN